MEDTSFPCAIYASDSVPYEAKPKSLSSRFFGHLLLFHLLFLFPKDLKDQEIEIFYCFVGKLD